MPLAGSLVLPVLFGTLTKEPVISPHPRLSSVIARWSSPLLSPPLWREI